MDRRQFLKLMVALGASGAFLDSFDVIIKRALSAQGILTCIHL